MEGFIRLLVGTLTRQSKGIHLGGHVPIFMYGRHTMKNKKSVRTSNSLGSKTKREILICTLDYVGGSRMIVQGILHVLHYQNFLLLIDQISLFDVWTFLP